MSKQAPTVRSREVASLQLKVRYQNMEALKPYAGNARTHSDKQIAQIAASIKNFGFNNPVLVDSDNRLKQPSAWAWRTFRPSGWITYRMPSVGPMQGRGRDLETSVIKL